ncbi:hypothetical protein IYR97_13730 [Pseudomonas fulva]|uniref:Uncharacterized protein n=1 Tax=Pseudomonas fulva TaxID=47880 RepID=A0A7S9LEA7_9PSED|nr:hypothetical protein [Pseudomonas fulva]QPH42390.1 hypothetical protein IYR97_13730 [Pseudomonas fulva]QPH47454.1 hypothetical protein IZU98_13625 [Pseudomonas fulva]
MSNNQMVSVPREQLAKVREWIESARDGVLYPIARDFDGVVGRNAEGLGQGAPELLDLIDGFLAAPAEQHHADPAEVERLRKENESLIAGWYKDESDNNRYWPEELQEAKSELAERDALLQDLLDYDISANARRRIEEALSISAELKVKS